MLVIVWLTDSLLRTIDDVLPRQFVSYLGDLCLVILQLSAPNISLFALAVKRYINIW